MTKPEPQSKFQSVMNQLDDVYIELDETTGQFEPDEHAKIVTRLRALTQIAEGHAVYHIPSEVMQ